MATLATLPIALTTLSAGAHPFGPISIPVGVTWARFVIDRTAGTQSLNSLPATTTLRALVEESEDGGVTWPDQLDDFTTPGGVWVIGGAQANQSFGFVPARGDPSSTTRRVRATVTTNAPISISGALTLGN